ncbi:TetR/AcrR family transcriptional regulator [Frankia sp. Cj3]|uniref:TetR/AcrR family transcriptional regulator n=1 Tax=Frankia sp. Cj3 TaxID=2880976 RepID=UPI001EF68FB2|nr:TetR/AcrR family transcriptional regulator [Frankia sp. Cj3]
MNAALELLREHRWEDMTMEAVAQEAGVSVATAYNHFKSKIGLAYRVSVQRAEFLKAEAAKSAERDPHESVTRYVGLVANFLIGDPLVFGTLQRAIERQEFARQPDDSSLMPHLDSPFVEIIKDGQERGVFRSDVSAEDVAAYHINALLLRRLAKLSEDPEETAAFTLSQLFPVLEAQESGTAEPIR